MAHRPWRDLWAPVDGASLAFARIAFGSLAAWNVGRHFAAGWIERDYVDPAYHFAFFDLEWLRPWPQPFTHLHFAALGLCAIGIALGFYYRLCAVLFFLGFTLVFLWEQAVYQNHNYLIALLALLFCVVPAARVASVDAWRAGRTDASVPRGALWLLRFQVAVPYVFGGIAKLGGDWLDGQPMGMWLAERSDFPVLGRLFHEPWMVTVFVWGGLLIDLAVVPLLLHRRTRAWTFAAVVVFHLTNARLFSIGVFPWLMIALTTLFFSPDWPRRLWHRLAGARTPSSTRAASPTRTAHRHPILALGMVGWILVQVAVPARPLLYPGRSDWTEEGQRFSWQMKLRDKRALVYPMTLRSKSSGRVLPVDPRDYLTNRQVAEMAKHPGMIRQFARHVCRSAAGDYALHADIRVSLNGRPFQPLVRQDVDLAANEVGEWIVPLATELPDEPIATSDAR